MPTIEENLNQWPTTTGTVGVTSGPRSGEELRTSGKGRSFDGSKPSSRWDDLEIAPGFGRVTQYLKDLCDS